MNKILLFGQIITAIVLVVLILIQPGGSGFGKSSSNKSSFTRRGLERIVFRLTFIVAALFILLSIFTLIF